MPLLAVKNDRTELIGADELFLSILDKELRYPSQLAQYQVEGIAVPTDDGWDGWVRMLHRRKTGPPWVATGLLPYVENVARRFGFAVSLDDRRERPEEGFPELVRIPLRDYQEEAVREAVRAGRGVLDMPPRSGKTRAACELIRQIALPTVWMAPTDRIVRQTVETLTGFFGPGFVQHLVGARGYGDCVDLPVVACTAATAIRLPQEFYDSRQCVLVDEFHHCLGDTTRVLTAIGEKVITEIGVGDLVWTRGKQRCELRPVVHVWKYSSPEFLLRLYTDGGVLELTEEHDVYTDEGKVRAKCLREGSTIYLQKMRKDNFQTRSVFTTRKKLFRSEFRLSGVPRLRRMRSQKILWRASSQLFREKFFQRSSDSQKSDEEAGSKLGIPEKAIRADAGRWKSGKTRRRERENQKRLEGVYSSAVWARGRGKRLSTDGNRRASGVIFRTIGFCFGVSGIDGRAGKRGCSVLSNRFCRSFAKNSCRSRRFQPQRSGRAGQKKRSVFNRAGLGGFSFIGEISSGIPQLVSTRVQKIEKIKTTSKKVFDLEVQGNHNYIANGILVSNSAASTYRDVFSRCKHIYYRYGMTGTFFRSGADIMALHAMLSNTIYKVTSEELLRRGYLVPTYVAFVPVVAPFLRGVANAFNTGHGKYGIHEHVGRNQLVGYCALTLLKAGRRVLILVGTKKQGRLIQDILLNFVRADAGPGRREFKPVEFVSTDVDRPKQARILDSFENGEEVKILIGTSLLGEGVDMPSTDALVYARGEQAEVGLTQAMYRVSTAVEGKRQALIVDFADRHNRHLMAHSKERLRVYFNEPTFHVSVLDAHQNLPNWILGCPGIAA